MLSSLTTDDKDSRDRFWEGDADDGVRRLAQELGWGDELEEMIKEGTERLEKEWLDKTETSEDSAAAEVDKVVGEVEDVVGSNPRKAKA
jgi:NAD-dependent histone deacetylase SIR2